MRAHLRGGRRSVRPVPHGRASNRRPGAAGQAFDDAYASELAQCDHLLFICGHYEGIDERVYALADHVISLGDYVLTRGELASMIVIDAVVRKLPGVLGAEAGPCRRVVRKRSLEYPQYTRPLCFCGMEVEVFAVRQPRRHRRMEARAEPRTDGAASARLARRVRARGLSHLR